MQSDSIEISSEIANPITSDIRVPARYGGIGRHGSVVRGALRALLIASVFCGVLQVLGSDTLPGELQMRYAINEVTQGWGFDLAGWEVNALTEKARAALDNPAAHLDSETGGALVRAYLERGRQIVALDDEALVVMARSTEESLRANDEILAQVAALRALQVEQHPSAEAVIQQQIATILEDMGIGVIGRVMPPVLFSFSESPRKLVISPRTVIATTNARMLNPSMPLDVVEQIEDALEARSDVSVYIADTGGLGAFPTIVVDDAPLPWILSTVAHEWVHTYLAFFPLGFNYGVTPDNTTINESVADIVGDEVGARAIERFYPELAPVALPADAIEDGAPAVVLPSSFDYFAEMRHTRETVDKFLRVGRVGDAERYMELRRQLFVEEGYPIRTLNQAYFAFHGSYGTGAAADVSSPDAVAPLVTQLRGLVELRALTNDAATFLRTIRSIRDREGLEELLREWEAAP